MYLNYNVNTLINLLFDIFNYKIFIYIICASLILLLLCILNANNKLLYFFIIIINFLLVFLIIYYYNTNLFNIKIFNRFNHNMYFYFLNSIVFLILINISIYKNILRKLSILFYILLLPFILFSLFMTYYLKNIHIFILGNIYPCIVFGNLIILIYYVIVIFKFILKALTCHA